MPWWPKLWIANATTLMTIYQFFGSGPGGSRARRAQEYPRKLVKTILRAYEASLEREQPLEIYIVSEDDILAENYHLEKIFNPETDVVIKNVKFPENDMAVKTNATGDNNIISKNNATLDTNHISKNNATLNTHDISKNVKDSEILAAEGGELAVQSEQEEGSDQGDEHGSWLPREKPFSVEQLVRRAHCGLGHIANDRLARILQQAGARKEAVDYAKSLHCDICLRHRHTAPPRAAAPPKELRPNQIIGVDTVYLPGIQPGGKLKMALNFLDWATRFQLVVPLADHTPRAARRALLQWIRIFGVPERIYDDLGKEFRGCFEIFGDQEAIH
eukprot:s2710_g9.t1